MSCCWIYLTSSPLAPRLITLELIGNFDFEVFAEDVFFLSLLLSLLLITIAVCPRVIVTNISPLSNWLSLVTLNFGSNLPVASIALASFQVEKSDVLIPAYLRQARTSSEQSTFTLTSILPNESYSTTAL